MNQSHSDLILSYLVHPPQWEDEDKEKVEWSDFGRGAERVSSRRRYLWYVWYVNIMHINEKLLCLKCAKTILWCPKMPYMKTYHLQNFMINVKVWKQCVFILTNSLRSASVIFSLINFQLRQRSERKRVVFFKIYPQYVQSVWKSAQNIVFWPIAVTKEIFSWRHISRFHCKQWCFNLFLCFAFLLTLF